MDNTIVSTVSPVAAIVNNEPLLTPDESRYVMFPIKHNDVWNMYKKQMDSFWRCEEINMSKDLAEWDKMNDDEKYFIKMVLAFFAASDGIVMENLAQRFMSDIENAEIRAFYSMQIFMENIHCVAGNTTLLTKTGYKKIDTLVDCNVDVWNGEEFAPVTVKYTGNQALYRVFLSNGLKLDCTDGHKWLVHDTSGNIVRIKTDEIILQKTELAEFTYPVIDFIEDNSTPEPYYSGKKASNINNELTIEHNKHDDVIPVVHIDVPINENLNTKINWLNGFFQTGVVLFTTPHNGNFISICSLNSLFLVDLQLLFSTLGVFTYIINNDDDRENPYILEKSENNTVLETSGLIPVSTPDKILLITDKQFHQLNKLGINMFSIQKQMEIDDVCNPDISVIIKDANSPIRVIDICKVSDDSPTYCFNEPKRHSGVFNGILTGQSEMYSILIDTYSNNEEEKNKLFNAICHFPCIKKKAEWSKKWINDKEVGFAARLVAFAIVEGIFFSSSFASIYWIKKRGLLPGLTLSNEFISRDEALHVEFAVLIYHKLMNKLDGATFYKIMEEAVMIEKEFILEAIPCRLIGMNSNLMSQYIEFVANRLCLQLGYDKLFPAATNPFDFMELISLNDKVNFFEKTNTQYALANKVIEGDPFDLSSEF
jgi:ribonucleotide reductase beta subunit family protein with ferritin-like domain